MKHITIFYLFLSFQTYLAGQKHDFNWLTCSTITADNTENIKFSFNKYPPEITSSGSEFNFIHYSLLVSDSAGMPKFGTDGCLIWSYIGAPFELIPQISLNHYTCLNWGGTTMNSAAFFIPFQTHYLLFTYSIFPNGTTSSPPECAIEFLNFSKLFIDTTEITVNPLGIPVTTGCFQAAAACKHSNGRDWWVILPDNHENKIYKILINENGVFPLDTQLIDHPLINGNYYGSWNSFSPNGEYFINTHGKVGTYLYSFDRCTGFLHTIDSIPKEIVHNQALFSPDSKYIYVIEDYGKKIYQFDITSSEINESKELIAEYDGFIDESGQGTGFGDMQLGPDGKIYIWAGQTKYAHIIHFPNRKGNLCTFEHRALISPQRFTGQNFYYPHYRLGPIDGSACDSLGIDNIPMAMYHYDVEDTLAPLAVTFTDASYYEPDSWQWSFGDGTVSSEQNPVHTYTSAGTYTVCLIASNNNGADTLCYEVTVTQTSSAAGVPAALPMAKVSPNPATDQWTVRLPAQVSSQAPSFRLYDMYGRLVLEEQLRGFEHHFPATAYPRGVYVWEMRWQDRAVQSGKLVLE